MKRLVSDNGKGPGRCYSLLLRVRHPNEVAAVSNSLAHLPLSLMKVASAVARTRAQRVAEHVLRWPHSMESKR